MHVCNMYVWIYLIADNTNMFANVEGGLSQGSKPRPGTTDN